MNNLQFREVAEAEFRERWLRSEDDDVSGGLLEELRRGGFHVEDAPGVVGIRAELFERLLEERRLVEGRAAQLAPLIIQAFSWGPVTLTTDVRPGRPNRADTRVKISRARESRQTAPVELRFSPRTLHLIRRGLSLHAAPLQGLIEDRGEQFDALGAQISNFVRERLMLTLGGVADLLTQNYKPQFTIADDGSFVSAIDLALQPRIPHVPKEFNDLSLSLCSDIVWYLLQGGRLEAGWGEVVIEGNGLTLVAKGMPVSPPKPVGRARLIE